MKSHQAKDSFNLARIKTLRFFKQSSSSGKVFVLLIRNCNAMCRNHWANSSCSSIELTVVKKRNLQSLEISVLDDSSFSEECSAPSCNGSKNPRKRSPKTSL